MKPAFEVKSARLDALAVQLHTADSAELEAHLQQRIGQYQELSSMPFLLDVQDFSRPEALDIATVAALFARHGLQIIGLRHSDEAWAPYAAAAHNQIQVAQAHVEIDNGGFVAAQGEAGCNAGAGGGFAHTAFA